MGPRCPRAPDLREHPRAARAAYVVREARRAAHLRRDLAGGKRRAIAGSACGFCCFVATARLARIIMRGRRRPARLRTCAGTRTQRRCRLTQFDAQLAELTTAITRAVGDRPVSYRSGRFGFDASHVSALERFGYLVESSVAPLFYEAHKGGPDFVDAPVRRISSPTTPRSGRERAACSRCPVPPRLIGVCRRRSRVPTRVCHGRT